MSTLCCVSDSHFLSADAFNLIENSSCEFNHLHWSICFVVTFSLTLQSQVTASPCRSDLPKRGFNSSSSIFNSRCKPSRSFFQEKGCVALRPRSSSNHWEQRIHNERTSESWPLSIAVRALHLNSCLRPAGQPLARYLCTDRLFSTHMESVCSGIFGSIMRGVSLYCTLGNKLKV